MLGHSTSFPYLLAVFPPPKVVYKARWSLTSNMKHPADEWVPGQGQVVYVFEPGEAAKVFGRSFPAFLVSWCGCVFYT